MVASFISRAAEVQQGVAPKFIHNKNLVCVFPLLSLSGFSSTFMQYS